MTIKKMVSIALALSFILLSFSGCEKKNPKKNNSSDSDQTSSTSITTTVQEKTSETSDVQSETTAAQTAGAVTTKNTSQPHNAIAMTDNTTPEGAIRVYLNSLFTDNYEAYKYVCNSEYNTDEKTTRENLEEAKTWFYSYEAQFLKDKDYYKLNKQFNLNDFDYYLKLGQYSEYKKNNAMWNVSFVVNSNIDYADNQRSIFGLYVQKVNDKYFVSDYCTVPSVKYAGENQFDGSKGVMVDIWDDKLNDLVWYDGDPLPEWGRFEGIKQYGTVQ